MRFRKIKIACVAAGVATMSFMGGTPVEAVGSTSLTDATGVDFDASCVASTTISPPPPPNWNTGAGCTVSLTDGSFCSVDLAAMVLASASTGHVSAQWSVQGGASCSIPPAGSTTPPDGTSASYDLPDSSFVGGNYFALFQNKTIQTLAKYTACPQIPPRPTPIVNRFATWKDGAHFFVAFGVNWDGTRWVHSAQLGEYFPGPDGGFSFFELGTNDGVDDDGDGSLWDNANPYHTVGTAAGQFNVSFSGNSVTVNAPGIYQSPDTTNCSNGHFDYWFARPGDTIANVKTLVTANQVVTLPQTIPLSITCGATGGVVCESDLTTVGGFVFYVDITSGNSTPGALNSNTTGVSYTGGAIGVTDTLGDGPTCPTPTFGGLIQENPLWTVDTACQIDDDPVSRGSFLQEYWDTTFGFTF